jgi:hypothetical protein
MGEMAHLYPRSNLSKADLAICFINYDPLLSTHLRFTTSNAFFTSR